MASAAKSVIVPRRHKFGARATTIDGIRFDSAAEAAHYAGLKILERAKEINDLHVHRRWKLYVNGDLVTTYESDFDYVTKEGRQVVCDVKGFTTPEAKIKIMLFQALYKIPVTIIPAKQVRA